MDVIAKIKQLSHAQIPQVVEALVKKGYSEQAMENILGQNWLRVSLAPEQNQRLSASK